MCINNFKTGNFVLHESSRKLSGLALDQAHEHNNGLVKADGGAIGITEHPSALLRWMTAGPEICQITKEYEDTNTKTNTSMNHHEDTPSNQKQFLKDVQNLTDYIHEIGNPFLDESDELFNLISKKVTNSNDLYSYENKGKEQFDSYMNNLQNFHHPIKQNNFNIFGDLMPKKKNSSTRNLKKDCVLFSNLFIICQTRQLDLNDFFKYENQLFPPSISNGGELYSTKKSDIITLLEEKVETSIYKPQSDCLIVDGSALVYSLYSTETTFESFANNVFVKKVEGFSYTHQRVDIVFDQYNPESLKSFTRQQRGEGIRRKVTPSGKVPKDWNTFLRNYTNKTELF